MFKILLLDFVITPYGSYKILSIAVCPLGCLFNNIAEDAMLRDSLILREIEESVFLDVQDMINMARLRFLRHFQVSNFAFQNINEEIFKKQKPSICFENLQHLSRPYLYYDCHIDKLMRLMPNLRKLNLHIFFFIFTRKISKT